MTTSYLVRYIVPRGILDPAFTTILYVGTNKDKAFSSSFREDDTEENGYIDIEIWHEQLGRMETWEKRRGFGDFVRKFSKPDNISKEIIAKKESIAKLQSEITYLEEKIKGILGK